MLTLTGWRDFLSYQAIYETSERGTDSPSYNIIFFLSDESDFPLDDSEGEESDLASFLKDISGRSYCVVGKNEKEAGFYMRKAVCDFLTRNGYKIDPSGYEITVFDDEKEYYLFGFDQN